MTFCFDLFYMSFIFHWFLDVSGHQGPYMLYYLEEKVAKKEHKLGLLQKQVLNLEWK